MRKKPINIIAFFLMHFVAWSQPDVKQYQRADSTRYWDDLVTHHKLTTHWVSDSVFWYQTNTVSGWQYKLVKVNNLKGEDLFDKAKLLDSYNNIFDSNISDKDFKLDKLKVEDNGQVLKFVANGFNCSYQVSADSLIKGDKVKKSDSRYWAASWDELANEPVTSPDGNYKAYIKNYNVYLKELKSNKESQLSFDGSEGDLYSSYLKWSPDSKKLATFKVKQHVKKYFYMIESSPKDQIQPKLHKKEYLKPGDVVPIRRPALFHIEGFKQIPLKVRQFEHQYRVGQLEWRKDSKAFTFEFNERGHQRYKVLKVDASDGQITTLVEELSDTYVEYIQNRRWDIGDGKEMVWKSARDGWFHFYLIDGNTGEVKNQITSGKFTARDIISIDEEKREMIFSANGVQKKIDPYLIQYYRIGLDGSNMIKLTPEKTNHKTWFNPSKTFFVDKYSRVDLPAVTVLRDARDGKILMTLEKSDITSLKKIGWQFPEVFTAKGRDNETDIWGIIYRPSNFDPDKKYPIIEYIYAGPGANHVPKDFFARNWKFSALAELGFVIVQIDGMGTGHRSKAFADVAWKNLMDAGLPDRMKWIKAAAKKYPYMDVDRIGIYGGSAGGQSSTAAVLQYPEFYKVAVSACGCHDNRMDKIWWNELWMGYPVDSSYVCNSNVTNAHKLQGKLMLILGELDDNVDPSSTLQVVDALIRADKEFEFVMLPGFGHTLGGNYGERKRRDFFVKHLLGIDPPDWNVE